MYMRRISNWFVDLFGFQESCIYEEVQNHFRVQQRLNPLTRCIENVLELNEGQSIDSWSVGRFRTPSLGELRMRNNNVHIITNDDEIDHHNKDARNNKKTRLKLMIITGDIAKFHGEYENCGCVIQVASQLNCLEMVSNHHTPEDGVTAYANDHTQGPACCLCTQPAIVYRNYLMDWSQLFNGKTTRIVQNTDSSSFVPSSLNVDDDNDVTEKKKELYGQRAEHQLDNSDDLRKFLEEQIGNSSNNIPLFQTQNGYTMITHRDQLVPMQRWYNSQQQMMMIEEQQEQQQEKKDDDKKDNNSLLDKAKSLLKIGIHEDIEVTHCGGFGKKKIQPRQLDSTSGKMYVTHALCSACAINYNQRNSNQQDWEGLARLILESTYESTLFAAVEARQRWNPDHDCNNTSTPTSNHLPFPGAKKVFLTLVGGGVFGNDLLWILDAIEKACLKFRYEDLEVNIVCYNQAEKQQLQDRVKEIQGKLTSTF